MAACISLLPMLIIGVIVLFVVVPAINASGNYDKLVANGIPAQGILLAVQARPSMRAGQGMRTYQRRQVRIDVEIPGHPPYEITTSPFIPSNLVRDVLPGATVELRVDPKNHNNIAIVGPGVGFSVQGFLLQSQGAGTQAITSGGSR